LSGVNTNTIQKRWALSFEPVWSDDEAEMLKRDEIREVTTA
jgi:hypothetical protein